LSSKQELSFADNERELNIFNVIVRLNGECTILILET
jgi:hypothetical protein